MENLESLTHAEKARQLVENPDHWDQLVELYGSSYATYNKLRNAAGSELDFNEYVELLSICIDNGDEEIRETIEQRLPRSVKNQVLRGSPRGQSYPIETLAEIDNRLAKYEQIGVTVPSLYEEVTVIVEHLHDMDLAPHPKALHLRLLLAETPDEVDDREELIESVALVARNWLVLETPDSSTLETAVEETAPTFGNLALDPLPEDERNTETRLKEASETPFSQKLKEDLYLSICTRTSSLEAFAMYFYLSARRHIEAERHHGNQVTRGELLVAREQLKLLSSFGDLPVDPTSDQYIRSDYHLVKGLNAAGEPWLSTKDRRNRGNPRYQTAAVEYANAAYYIRDVNPERALKHMGLAFRHLANQYPHDYASQRLIHTAAITFLLETDWGEENTELQQELIHTQKYRKTEAEAWLALKNDGFSKARELANECEMLRESVALTEIQSHIDPIYRLADGREAELEEQYDDAIAHYRMVAETNPSIHRRQRLAEVKYAIVQDDYEEARELAETTFPDNHIVSVAVRVMTDEPMESSSISWNEPIELLDTTVATVLRGFIDTATSSHIDLAGPLHSLFKEL